MRTCLTLRANGATYNVEREQNQQTGVIFVIGFESIYYLAFAQTVPAGLDRAKALRRERVVAPNWAEAYHSRSHASGHSAVTGMGIALERLFWDMRQS